MECWLLRKESVGRIGIVWQPANKQKILFTTKDAKNLARQSRDQRSARRTDRRGTEVAEFGVLLHKILFSAYSASPQ